MINFEKANLIPVSKGKVKPGSKAVMINGMPFIFGGEGEYYLCSYVNRTYASYEFTVSGLSETLFADVTDWNGAQLPDQYRNINPNGTYTPYKQSEDGVMNWRWKNENNCYCYYSHMQMGWVFTPIDDNVEVNIGIGTFPVYASASWENTPYPWDSSLSWTDGSGTAVSFAIAQIIPEPVEQYWNGYKLETDEETGKWTISDTSSKLTYADYMPVAGRFYDKACTMEIADIDLEEQYRYSTPINMTSLSNDTWRVSTNANIYGEQYAWGAFTDSGSPGFRDVGDVSNPYLQWQNLKRPVILKKLHIETGFPDYLDSSLKIEGSNDGSTWTEIYSGNANSTTPECDHAEYAGDILLEDNNSMFFYHRITRSHWCCYILKAWAMLDRDIPE